VPTSTSTDVGAATAHATVRGVIAARMTECIRAGVQSARAEGESA